jgi:hypothetical protein
MDRRKDKILTEAADKIHGKKQKRKEARAIETKALERAGLPVGGCIKGSVQKA